MIGKDDIEELLINQPDVSLVKVEGDGYHYQITVVSSAFQNLGTLKRQQKIYALLKEWIAEGSLHAVTINTLTPEEWEKING